MDETAAQLERQLQHEQDARKTERFFWIFALSGLVYAVLVHMANSAVAAAGLFLLLVIFLFGIAAWCGVDHVRVLLERLFNKYLGNKE